MVVSSMVVSLGKNVLATSLQVAWGFSQLGPELEAAFQRFADANGIELNVVPRTGSWANHYERLLLAHLGGVPFDVMFIDQQYVPTAVQQVFEDLTPYIDRDRFSLGQFIPQAVTAFQWKNAQYALPAVVNNNAIWYNVDLFSAAGLATIPTDPFTVGDSWSWDDFVNAARRLTKDHDGDGRFDELGLWTLPPWLHAPWLWDGDWVNEEGRPDVTATPVVTGITKFAELGLVHQVVRAPTVAHSVSGGFASGRVGMIIYGMTQAMQLQTIEWTYSVGLLPKGTSRDTVFYSDGFAMARESKNKSDGWTLIKAFTTAQEYALPVSSAAACLPAYIPLHRFYLAQQAQQYPSVKWHDFANAQFTGRLPVLRFSPNFSQIDTLMSQAYSAVTSGEKPAITALSEVQPLIERLY
jgi:multiple sugar transport system substrate-binding protein